MSRWRSKRDFKRVPAVDKCFSLLELFAHSGAPLRISEIARNLDYNKSTVYNLVHTLRELEVLEQSPEKEFSFGTKFYALGRCSGSHSALISTVHPFLEEINRETRLSVFLGIRSEDRAVILDKVDSPDQFRVSSETGASIPLLPGAGGRVLLAQVSDGEVERILSGNGYSELTPSSRLDRRKCMGLIQEARREGFAVDDEESIKGVRAIAVPLRFAREDLQAALWAAGLKNRIDDALVPSYVSLMKKTASKIELRFSMA